MSSTITPPTMALFSPQEEQNFAMAFYHKCLELMGKHGSKAFAMICDLLKEVQQKYGWATAEAVRNWLRQMGYPI